MSREGLLDRQCPKNNTQSSCKPNYQIIVPISMIRSFEYIRDENAVIWVGSSLSYIFIFCITLADLLSSPAGPYSTYSDGW